MSVLDMCSCFSPIGKKKKMGKGVFCFFLFLFIRLIFLFFFLSKVVSPIYDPSSYWVSHHLLVAQHATISRWAESYSDFLCVWCCCCCVCVSVCLVVEQLFGYFFSLRSGWLVLMVPGTKSPQGQTKAITIRTFFFSFFLIFSFWLLCCAE